MSSRHCRPHFPTTRTSMPKNSRVCLGVSIACLVLFVANLVLGKLEVSSRIDTNIHLDGVPEFLLLLVCVIFFVISTLLKERAEANNSH